MPWLRVNHTRLLADSAVPTPILSLEVHLDCRPGQPGACPATSLSSPCSGAGSFPALKLLPRQRAMHRHALGHGQRPTTAGADQERAEPGPSHLPATDRPAIEMDEARHGIPADATARHAPRRDLGIGQPAVERDV